MLLIYVHHELVAESTDGHGPDIGVRDLPFDSAEEGHEGAIR